MKIGVSSSGLKFGVGKISNCLQ